MPLDGKSSAILGVLRLEGQPPHFSQDFDDLSSRARVTVPGFRTARSVASRRYARGSTLHNLALSSVGILMARAASSTSRSRALSSRWRWAISSSLETSASAPPWHHEPHNASPRAQNALDEGGHMDTSERVENLERSVRRLQRGARLPILTPVPQLSLMSPTAQVDDACLTVGR